MPNPNPEIKILLSETSLFLASPRIITIALAGCVTPVYRQENGTGELLDTLLQNDTDIPVLFDAIELKRMKTIGFIPPPFPYLSGFDFFIFWALTHF